MRSIFLSYAERLTGSARNDTLTVADSDGSSNAANMLKGLGGNDTLDAREGAGNDTADGGTGTDTCQTEFGDRSLNCP